MMLVLGSRGSKLARWQAEYVRSEIHRVLPGLPVEVQLIKTKGDKILDVALSRIGDKGLFTREIEEALLGGEVDLAVHSLKDLPTELPEGLRLGAVMPREDSSDVFISEDFGSLADLPRGAVIGTSSLRRIAQVKAVRPDIECYELRGNVDTRIRRMKENHLAGIILAYAGVKRLGLEHVISEKIDRGLIMPAVGQGAVALEARIGDERVAAILDQIGDPATLAAITAERSFLHHLGGGCQVPIAAQAEIREGQLILQGLVASLDGTRVIRGQVEGGPDRAAELGTELGRELCSRGADEIINSLR